MTDVELQHKIRIKAYEARKIRALRDMIVEKNHDAWEGVA